MDGTFRTKQSNKSNKKNKEKRRNNSNTITTSRGTGKTLGRGADTVSNVLRVDFQNPRLSGNDGKFRISKREFIANIPASSEFTAIKYEVNPGNSTTFPWLSGIAPNFEKYKFLRLRFVFQTSQSTFVPGTVIMAPEFNVTDPLPTNKAQILEYAYAKRSAVWENFSVPLKMEDVMTYKSYYTRNDTQLIGDKKLYDPLYFIVGTDGLNEDLNIVGELWIDYEVEFSLPQRLNETELQKQNYKRIYWTGGNYALHLGNAIIQDDGDLPVTFDQPNSTFSFPSGYQGLMQIETVEGHVGNTGYTYAAMDTTVVDGEQSNNFGSFRGTQLTGDKENCCEYKFLNINPGGQIRFNNNGFATAQTTGGVLFEGRVFFLRGPPIGVPLPSLRKRIKSKGSEEELIKELLKQYYSRNIESLN